VLSVASVRSAGGAANYFAKDDYYVGEHASEVSGWGGRGRLNSAFPVRSKNRSSRISSRASCPMANRSAIPSGGGRAST
jgi:hypothetical protein